MLRRARRRLFFNYVGRLFYQDRVDADGRLTGPRRVLATLNQRVIERGWSPPWVLSHDECKALWASDGANDADGAERRWDDYLTKDVGVVEFLHGFWSPDVDRASAILELGSNCGANLNALYGLGYESLAGIEINRAAVGLMARRFPHLAGVVPISLGSLEETLVGVRSRSVDVVFTMAVLMHVHPKANFVFPEIARIARRFIVSIELEVPNCAYVFSRNYRRVFEALGCPQLRSTMITPEGFRGVSRRYDGYVARLFAVSGQG